MKLAPRWKVLLHSIRIFREHLHDDMNIYMDGKFLKIELTDLGLVLLDDASGEILVEFGEDGTPCYSTEWADAPMDYEVSTDFPMYDHEN